MEEYLRLKDLDSAGEYLDQWAEAFPAEKLEGYWSLLEVRWRMAKLQYADAAAEAQILARVNPQSNQGAKALMLAVEAYRKLEQADKAEAALKQVMKTFPESPLAAEAAKQLGVSTQPSSQPASQPGTSPDPVRPKKHKAAKSDISDCGFRIADPRDRQMHALNGLCPYIRPLAKNV